MTNDAVRHLAAFRVRKPGNENYKSLPMTGEQESCRRTYMRQMLQKPNGRMSRMILLIT